MTCLELDQLAVYRSDGGQPAIKPNLLAARNLNIAAVIVAAGRGTRIGGSPPKQYRSVGRVPILALSINRLVRHPQVSNLIAVIAEEDRPLFDRLVEPALDREVNVAVGGSSRSQSVLHGLQALDPDEVTHVLIHDGARPFVPVDLVGRIIDALVSVEGAIPVLPVADALWSGCGGLLERPLAQGQLYRAQTPQGFAFPRILEAHLASGGNARDDAEVAVGAGMEVKHITGDSGNFKITGADDLKRAESRVVANTMRTGQGFDLHRFCDGGYVTLCGHSIPFERGLDGHSDADVPMHAIADALYGSVAEGDIGRWFPPTEARWKNADSSVFLEHAAGRVAHRGYAISSIDCTIICERPRIAPHAEKMRQNIARCLGIGIEQVSIKATTSERIGAIGRQEGIAALAVATIVGTCTG